MEEGPPMIRPAVSVGPEGQQQQQQVGYTIPGVLHFIKHEFTRFEKDRANWDIERAELQVHADCMLACSNILMWTSGHLL